MLTAIEFSRPSPLGRQRYTRHELSLRALNMCSFTIHLFFCLGRYFTHICVANHLISSLLVVKCHLINKAYSNQP